jgi:hypothetical protein
MKRGKKQSVSKKPAKLSEELQGRIVKRPEGYFWECRPGELRGPFDTREEAEIERLAGAAGDGDFESGESLHEAESELGVSEWIDPDTGDPAEDHIPRLEDH